SRPRRRFSCWVPDSWAPVWLPGSAGSEAVAEPTPEAPLPQEAPGTPRGLLLFGGSRGSRAIGRRGRTAGAAQLAGLRPGPVRAEPSPREDPEPGWRPLPGRRDVGSAQGSDEPRARRGHHPGHLPARGGGPLHADVGDELRADPRALDDPGLPDHRGKLPVAQPRPVRVAGELPEQAAVAEAIERQDELHEKRGQTSD